MDRRTTTHDKGPNLSLQLSSQPNKNEHNSYSYQFWFSTSFLSYETVQEQMDR